MWYGPASQLLHVNGLWYNSQMETLPAFVDETGVLTTSIRDQPVYGIGLLLVQDPARVTDSFYRLHFNLASSRAKQRSELRKAIKLGNRSPSLSEVDTLMWSTRHQEYKFSDVTPHNLQQYIDLLNLYFSFDCFKFHALLVDRSRPGFNLSPWNNGPLAGVRRARGASYCGIGSLKKCLPSSTFRGQPKGASISVEQEFSSVEFGLRLHKSVIRDSGVSAGCRCTTGLRTVRLEGSA